MTTILVGIDGSANSIAALRWAARRALATGATLRAIFAWRLPPVSMTPPSISMGLSPSDIVRHAASLTLDEYLAEAALPSDLRLERIPSRAPRQRC